MKNNRFLLILSVLLVLTISGCSLFNTGASAPESAQPTPEPVQESDAAQDEDAAEMDDDADADHDDADTDMDDTTDADTDTEEDAPTIDAAALYAENCAKCHGQNREGGGGPPLLPSRLTKDSSSYVERINEGSGPMPAFSGTLSVEEIDALVEFILTEPQ